MENEDIKQVIQFIDDMRFRGAIDITIGNIKVVFDKPKPNVTEVQVQPSAKKVEDAYAEEEKYWNTGLGDSTNVY